MQFHWFESGMWFLTDQPWDLVSKILIGILVWWDSRLVGTKSALAVQPTVERTLYSRDLVKSFLFLFWTRVHRNQEARLWWWLRVVKGESGYRCTQCSWPMVKIPQVDGRHGVFDASQWKHIRASGHDIIKVVSEYGKFIRSCTKTHKKWKIHSLFKWKGFHFSPIRV
jgi:hypothetical protein